MLWFLPDIFATLGLKKNTQSSIVKKLSSYKSNDTLRALIELDKIIMTLYILDYIDDEEMRKCVHRSLNRGESYHQLRSAMEPPLSFVLCCYFQWFSKYIIPHFTQCITVASSSHLQ